MFIAITSCFHNFRDTLKQCNLSMKKILFIFCLFFIYKVLEVFVNILFKCIALAVSIVYSGINVECHSSPKLSENQLHCTLILT